MNKISKNFGPIQALNDVSINLKKGEILVIVGENGAGKSTLMKILSGSYPSGSYSGEIIVGGKPRHFNSPADSTAAGIEMIYQEISVHLDLSVAENIFLGQLPTSTGCVQWKKMFANAEKYTNMVGLSVSVKQPMRTLSTSQQQMVTIARALSRNPGILVLDEPSSALTETEVEILFRNLENLRQQGISCIYITHKMKEVMRLADRVAVLRDGCLVSKRDRSELSIETIIEEMVNRKIENMFPKHEAHIGDEVLRVEDLTVSHPYNRRKNIVNGVSFNVRKGEILGIVGLVGAGRSEIANAVTGSIKPKKGRIYLDGKQLRIRSPKQSINKGMILLSEDRKLNGYVHTMSVAENISLASIKQITDGFVLNIGRERKNAQEYVKKLDIRVRSELDNIMSLSGGNQQKVVLAKWLTTTPKVLFLDEPTRGIDVGAKTQIYEIMNDLAASGMAVVMISSEMPELIGMCDRYIVLAEGEIKAELGRKEADEELFMKYATGA
jgi:ABC-type sugar transport system ATPase subunit